MKSLYHTKLPDMRGYLPYLMIEYLWEPVKTDEEIHVANVIQDMAKFRDTPEWSKLRKKLHD